LGPGGRDLRIPAILLLLLGPGLGTAEAGADLFLRFDVRDPRPHIEVPLDAGLLVRAARIDQGWEIAVVDPAAGPHPRNLLYHSPSWHGPYPTQILPWHLPAGLFPDHRVLPVDGHPYEVDIRLQDLRASGAGDEARFTSGAVEVQWRRMPDANPPPADVVPRPSP
jgi:hypothetical protein